MKRDKWKPSKHSKICSAHFTEDSFVTNPWSERKKLSDTAVPSIFTFPDHLVKTPCPRKQPADRLLSAESSTIMEPQEYMFVRSPTNEVPDPLPEPAPK
ncbi:hypothetical protein M8J77_023920 [Diaphorina citri]|nr:hypothetical protein M8J77_001741 [Diaphorina citri]KAI5753493.1 hypothetical protein M8J77_000665 [Diaphorina citri]KAI5756311.1 hypothetical protein M8J77_023920 [Diaphorina citri]